MLARAAVIEAEPVDWRVQALRSLPKRIVLVKKAAKAGSSQHVGKGRFGSDRPPEIF